MPLRHRSDLSQTKLRSAISNGSQLLADLDHRCGWARRFRDLLDDHVADLGGQDALSHAEQLLVRRASMLALQCELLEQKFSGHEDDAFVDPSGGSNDAMALAIGHRQDDIAVLDVIRERKPPFSPEAGVEEFAALLKSYRVSTVVGDRYGGEWPREQFRKHGIEYRIADKPRSDLYRDMLPAVNSGRVDLLDCARLTNQLIGLERRTSRGGKDMIDHAPGAHDDSANAVAGVLTAASAKKQWEEEPVELGLPIVWPPAPKFINDEFPQSLATYNWLRSQQR